MQGDSNLRLEWQAQIESVIHTLARAKLHDLFLPTAATLSITACDGRHSETEMVEQILGLGENHRNDADELDADVKSSEPHALDDGVLVEARRREILSNATRSRFGKSVSKLRIQRSKSSKTNAKNVVATESETKPDPKALGNISPTPSSLDSPAKASRTDGSKILTADVGAVDLAGRLISEVGASFRRDDRRDESASPVRASRLFPRSPLARLRRRHTCHRASSQQAAPPSYSQRIAPSASPIHSHSQVRDAVSITSSVDGNSFRNTSDSPSFWGEKSWAGDGRLQMLSEAMPSWGFGTRSIFMLHDYFGMQSTPPALLPTIFACRLLCPARRVVSARQPCRRRPPSLLRPSADPRAVTASAAGPDLLFFMLAHAFHEFDLFEHFAIDAQKLQNLCNAIVAGYNDHPYHNYIHACDVTHGTYWLLRQRLGGVADHRKSAAHSRMSAAVANCSTQRGSMSGGTQHQQSDLLLWEQMPKYDRSPPLSPCR